MTDVTKITSAQNRAHEMLETRLGRRRTEIDLLHRAGFNWTSAARYSRSLLFIIHA